MIENKKNEFHNHVLKLQQAIISKMQALDPDLKIHIDDWNRLDHENNPGGGGKTIALSGKLFENAGVNTSCIYGAIDPQFAKSLPGNSNQLWASGISLIIHPKNPKQPTTHANFRFINQGDRWWFGGGMDLTPYYPFEEDFKWYHQTIKNILDKHDPQFYPQMKNDCDNYFTNHHRGKEMRGIGGFFFDHFNRGDLNNDFNFVTEISNHFIESYFPLVEKRLLETYNDADEDFQLHRRGRYVEFNLLHDRGTLFGLKTNGRTDSILISLPHRVKFSYQYSPAKKSPHEKMMEYYYPKNWF